MTPHKYSLFNTIYSNPNIIPALNRLGIRLGVGELSLEEAAIQANINLENLPFLRALLISFTADIPESELGIQFSGVNWNKFTEEYFNKTATYFKLVQLPNIEKHLNAFIGMSMATDTAKGQLIQLSNLLKDFSATMTNDFCFFKLQSILKSEALLNEMQFVMIKYLDGNFNDNLCHATIFALHLLETDIKKHRYIIMALLPDKLTFENSGTEDNYREVDNAEILSAREKEVLVLVAKGKLNKEIADELNISFQTVLSHRKNISAKLGIKTVAGLIFYAIRAGLIEI